MLLAFCSPGMQSFLPRQRWDTGVEGLTARDMCATRKINAYPHLICAHFASSTGCQNSSVSITTTRKKFLLGTDENRKKAQKQL